VRFLPAFSYSRFGLDHKATPADFMDARSDSDTRSQPADPLFWESFCAVCKFTSGNLMEILLYPLDLGFGRRRSQRGRPVLADPETGKKIITRLARLSKELGTEIVYQDGYGVIRGY
jgi:poly-gamma-glutamate synthesis protein (capsule biosynthesis protein)